MNDDIEKPASSVSTPSAAEPQAQAQASAPTDETWRGGYATAASRRRMMSACSWGNGVRWNRPVGKVGQWVRIYPHTLPKDDEHRHNVKKVTECLMIEIPQMNMLVKLATLHYQHSRLGKLNDFLKEDPIFQAKYKGDEAILLRNKKYMYNLLRLINIGVTMSAIFWPIMHIARRYNDPSEVVPSYVPFATDTWAKYSLSVFIENCPVLWVGYGHLNIDILVSTYYANGQAQLKIIRNQIEHFLDEEKKGTYGTVNFQYRDLKDDSVQKKFVEIVKRYEKLVWYTNEVDAIFYFPLSFQFWSTSVTVCFVIYQMTVIDVMSLAFVFLVLLFCMLLTQVFLYCYYGNMVEFESQLLNTSMYNSDWLMLSPSFRKQMVIVMSCWSQPIQPKVCWIIPLCFNTFVTIVKSSYTLYTFLVTAKVNKGSY